MRSNEEWQIMGLNPKTGEAEQVEILFNVLSIKKRSLSAVRFSDGSIGFLDPKNILLMPDFSHLSDD